MSAQSKGGVCIHAHEPERVMHLRGWGASAAGTELRNPEPSLRNFPVTRAEILYHLKFGGQRPISEVGVDT